MTKTAQLFRMATPKNICPSGLKSRDLLKRKGYVVEEHLLETRDAVDAFKAAHDVPTTPQTFIGGERLGGYSDLLSYFSIPQKDKNAKSYTPVLAVFFVAALLSFAMQIFAAQSVAIVTSIELFIALSMCLLALQKLRDLPAFQNTFITYDLLGMRYTPYAYIYAFVELFAGALMVAGVLWWLAAPIALFIAGINGISVFKAVYIDKRELRCACVGGNSNVPLGAISLTENIMMVAMALWMLFKGVF